MRNLLNVHIIVMSGVKLAPARQPMAGDFSFGTVNMTCNLPKWQVEF